MLCTTPQAASLRPGEVAKRLEKFLGHLVQAAGMEGKYYYYTTLWWCFLLSFFLFFPCQLCKAVFELLRAGRFIFSA